MFKTTIIVRGNELDSNNHVNNAVYLNYFEQGRWEAFREAGLLEVIKNGNLTLVVTDIRIRYMRESLLFDELEIITNIVRNSPFLLFRQRIVHKATGQPIARADTKTIFIDKTRSPKDIPPIILSTLNI